MRGILALALALGGTLAAEERAFPAPGAAGETLVIYSSLDTPVAQPLIAAFQARHPTVTVIYHDLLASEIAARIVAETDGQGVTADLGFLSAMDLSVKLANDGYARALTLPEAARWPDWANWRDTAFALTVEAGVIVYHRPAFPEGAPATRAALIDWLGRAPPGRIGTYDIARSAVGFLLLARDQEHFPEIWDLVRGLGRARAQLWPTSQDVIDRVATGELWLGYNVLGSYAADQAAVQPDLGVILPADHVVLVSRVALVPRAAANPEGGETFLRFLMSPEGQGVMAEALRLPAVSPEVGGAGSLSALEAELGARLRPVPVGPGLLAYLDQSTRAQILARWSAAIIP